MNLRLKEKEQLDLRPAAQFACLVYPHPLRFGDNSTYASL